MNDIQSNIPGGEPGDTPCTPFPIDKLPSSLADMARAVAEVYHVPFAMPAVIALLMVSAAIGRGLQILSVFGGKTMANLFALISAYSGTGKSAVLRIMREPLDMLQQQLNSCPVSSEGIGGFEGMFSDIGRGKDIGSAISILKNSQRQLVCSDVTGPALVRLLAENRETILNASAEAGNLLQQASNSNSQLGQLLLMGYSGDRYEYHRATKKAIVLNEPCISVCWLCQPHRLEKFLSSDRLMDDGLLARFFVFHSGAGMGYLDGGDKTIPSGISANYGAVISSLFNTYGQRVAECLVCETTPDAWEVLRWHHNRRVDYWNAQHEHLRPCISRWTEQAWRLTLVLHAATHGGNSHSSEVDRHTAESAVALQEWLAEQQMRIIAGAPLRNEADRLRRLYELLRESDDSEITLRDLQNSHGFPRDEVYHLVRLFPSRLQLKKIKPLGGGRPSEVLRLVEDPS